MTSKNKKTKTKSKNVKKKAGKPKTAKKKTTKKKTSSKKKIVKKKTIKKTKKKTSIKTKKKIHNIRHIKKERKEILKKDDVRKYLIHHAGEHAILIVQNLIEPATDEEIAKKLKVRVSEVRSTLNKLHTIRLTEYSRSKDSDTGWYTYKWIVRHNNVMGITKIIDDEIAEKLKNIPDTVYYCENCGDEAWTFDEAIDMQFKCPRCGSILTEADEKFKEKLKKLYL